ncbi:MAG: hypothetical protein ABW076_12995 [Candidatus Thiodiazotropha sp.]
MKPDPKLINLMFVTGILAATFALNASAMSGSWRFDDGYLLDYASRFSPWDYFFNPAITRGYSLNNLTPFNPLIYDLNLGLFGFSPRGFYLQHLLTLAGCGIASYFLLKIWAPSLVAFLGSLCFLAGAPSLFVAQQLMVGHYIAGLLFAVIATLAYALSLNRPERGYLLLVSVVFYMLATACKEVYFPLPFVLVFLNQGSWRVRFTHALPMFLWSFGYLLWRTITLGSLVGGYDNGPREFSVQKALDAYLGIPELLLGRPLISIGVVILLLALAGYLALHRRLNLKLIIVASLAVLLPLLPLTHFPGLSQANRYLLLPWWLISAFLSVAIGQMPRPGTALKSLMLIGITALSLSQAWHVQASLQPRLERFDAVYRFFLYAPLDRLYYSRDIKDAYYLDTVLNGARYAESRLSDRELKRRGLLVQARSLGLIDPTRYSVWSYDADCHCVTRLANPATADTPDPEKASASLLTLSLSPPYPPLFSRLSGEMRFSAFTESSVSIEGQWQGPRHDAEYQLILIVPSKPQRYRLRIFPDSDENPLQRITKFSLKLDYDDPLQARLAAAQACLLIRSAMTPLRLLLDGAPTQCQGLLNQEP